MKKIENGGWDMNYRNNNNNRRNNSGHNRPQRLGNIHEEVKKAKENLPYTFVPIKSKENLEVVEAAKFNSTTKGEEELYSGHLDCSMYALNYLLVGNEHKVIPLNDNENYTEIRPLKIDNKILISPYTLKGTISGFLGAYLGVKMKRLNEQKFLFRPNLNFRSDGNIQLAFGVVKENYNVDNDSLIIIKISDFLAPKYRTDRNTHQVIGKIDEGIPTVFWEDRNNRSLHNLTNNNKIMGNKSNKNYYCSKKKYKFYPQRFVDFDGEAEFSTFKYQNGLDGNGFLAKICPSLKGRPPRHNRISVRTFDVENVEMQISKDTLNQFIETYHVLEKFHLEDYPSPLADKKVGIKNFFKDSMNIKKGEIIFFEYDKSNNNVVTFGKTYYYPWAFNKGIFQKDFPDDIREEYDLTILEEMFGYSFDDKKANKKGSKSGKIHFNFAVSQIQLKTGSFTLERPGSPKPSSYEFYLQQDGKKIKAYGEPLVSATEARLSGRKFYKTNLNSQLPEEKTILENYNIEMMETIIANPQNPAEFKFKVNFDNLTKYELSLLKFALELDELTLQQIQSKAKNSENFFCHQIGYAKNYGIGAVKIKINSDSKIYKGQRQTPELISHPDFNIDEFKKDLNLYLKDAFGVFYNEKHYPGQLSMKDDSEKIIKWHSNIRKDYAEKRRKRYEYNKDWKKHTKSTGFDSDSPFKDL